MRWFILILLTLLAACQPDAATVAELPPASVQILVFWQPVTGTLAAGETHLWQFVGQGGDSISLRVTGSGATLTLALLDSGGIRLGEGDTLRATLPASGVYTVRVQADVAVAYTLGLGYTDRPNPAEATPTPLPQVVGIPTPTPPADAALGTFTGFLTSGETRDGTLAGDERHLYTFEESAGTFVTIRMGRLSGALDPLLALYDPQGSIIALDDNSGGDSEAVLRNIRLFQDGVYSIQVAGAGFPGSYRLSLLAAAEPFPVTPLASRVPVMAAAGFVGEENYAFYPFQGLAGQQMQIQVIARPGSAFDPVAVLLAPDGAEIASGDDSPDDLNPRFTASLPADGTYTVRVTGYLSSGDFTLTVDRLMLP